MTLCPKCGGSGLIPSPILGRFSGKPIPNCFTNCPECEREEAARYHRVTPDDFDFPVSWDFHRFIQDRYGRGDPGPERAPSFEREGQASTPERAPSTSQYRLDQLQGNLISLRDMLKQHVNEAKPRREKSKY